MINACKNMMIGMLWITQTAGVSLASQPLVGVMAPHWASPSRSEVTSSWPTGWFSNSRTLRAVCEGLAAGAVINTTGTGAAGREAERRGSLRSGIRYYMYFIQRSMQQLQWYLSYMNLAICSVTPTFLTCNNSLFRYSTQTSCCL